MGRGSRRAVRQPDDEDEDGEDEDGEDEDEDGEVPASAFDRRESEPVPEPEDGSLADESLDGDEPLEDPSVDDAASFSLRRSLATEPWSVL